MLSIRFEDIKSLLKPSLTNKLVIPISLLFLATTLSLGIYTKIRESDQHIEQEKEAWRMVSNTLVNSWKSTMLYTGSDNLARDQLSKEKTDRMLSLLITRNKKLRRINPESSPFSNSAIQDSVIKSGDSLSIIHDENGDRMLLTLIPVKAEAICVECHRKVNNHDIDLGEVMAVIELKTSLENVDRKISSDRNTVFAFLTIMSVLGIGFIHYHVVRVSREIKTLKGMIPMCANCKKVRKDDGYWTEVEKYLYDHTDVKTSHGICPECTKELYPDIYKQLHSGESSEED